MEEKDAFESRILAGTHFFLEAIIDLTMRRVYRLFGLPRERVTLHHAEIYLVTTTVLLLVLVSAAQYWHPLGWVVLFLGSLRIVQALSINLSTLLFDFTPVRESTGSVKRARWHFVAIGFSVLDTVLVFGFLFQFFDRRYQILNQHFPDFFEYFYYSAITFSTIGYGDIHPVTFLGRLIVLCEVSVALCFLIFFVSGALGRLHRNV